MWQQQQQKRKKQEAETTCVSMGTGVCSSIKAALNSTHVVSPSLSLSLPHTFSLSLPPISLTLQCDVCQVLSLKQQQVGTIVRTVTTTSTTRHNTSTTTSTAAAAATAGCCCC